MDNTQEQFNSLITRLNRIEQRLETTVTKNDVFQAVLLVQVGFFAVIFCTIVVLKAFGLF